MRPVTALIHVPDVETGLAWYRKAFPTAVPQAVARRNLGILNVDSFAIEIVRADSKVSAGKAGTVLYWDVGDLRAALVRFESIGATLYRGPLLIEGDLGMCQVEDPFGNLIGLRGSVSA